MFTGKLKYAYLILFLALLVLLAFSAGEAAQAHHYVSAVSSLIGTGFAIIGVLAFVLGSIRAVQDELEAQDLQYQRKMTDLVHEVNAEVDKLLENIAKKNEKDGAEATLERLIGEVAGEDGVPTEADLRTVESKFHEETGLYAKLGVELGGMSVEMSRKPLEAPKNSVTTTTGTTIDGVKRKSKSQKRREASLAADKE